MWLGVVRVADLGQNPPSRGGSVKYLAMHFTITDN